MKIIADNKGRAKTAIAFIWVNVVLQIANIALSFQYYNWLGSFSGKELIKIDEKVTGALMGQFLLFIVSSIVGIFVIVFFIMWFRRAYKNLHTLKARNLKRSEGWAAGGWFVPVLWWFVPFQIMKEIANGTSELAKKIQYHVPNMDGKIGLWWILWTLGFWGTLILNSAMGQGFADEYIVVKKAMNGAIITMSGGAIMLVSAFILSLIHI